MFLTLGEDGMPANHADALLDHLAAVHLIEPDGAGGYLMDPLVRDYAAEKGRSVLWLQRPNPLDSQRS